MDHEWHVEPAWPGQELYTVAEALPANVSICSLIANPPSSACFNLNKESIKGLVNGRDKHCSVLDIRARGMIYVEMRNKLFWLGRGRGI